MFYNSEAIQTLIDRIGWAEPIPPSNIQLSADNTKAESGRFVSDFHKMATVKNVLAVQENPNVEVANFQAYLQDLKRGAVREVLSRIFDNNERAYTQIGANNTRVDISGNDFSSRIASNPTLFDNAVGYQLAYDVLEMIATNARSNQTQRAIEVSYQELKAEQEGYTDERGKTVSPGVKGRLTAAINNVIDILFPEIIGTNNGIRNKSYLW